MSTGEIVAREQSGRPVEAGEYEARTPHPTQVSRETGNLTPLRGICQDVGGEFRASLPRLSQQAGIRR